MPYSVFNGANSISDYVVGISPIPLVDITHENQIVLPTITITVIWNLFVYAKDDIITIKRNNSRIASFIIEDITENFEANTKTLTCVDTIKLLERLYIKDFEFTDYSAALVAGEDYNGDSINMRYYMSATTAPHRRKFVTLTHMVKMCLLKGSLATIGNIDISDLYGNIESGFVYWDRNEEEAIPIYLDQLCYHPFQIKYTKMTTVDQVEWECGTLLDLLLYTLFVLNASLRWVGDKIVISRRKVSAALSSDAIYGKERSTWLNAYDIFSATISYVSTIDLGFTSYYEDLISIVVNEQWTAPAEPVTGKRINVKSFAFLRHALAHYRYPFENGTYECHEMHLEAYDSEDIDDYKFAKQFVQILFNRVPSSGYIETFRTTDNPAVLGERKLLKLSIDILSETASMEC